MLSERFITFKARFLSSPSNSPRAFSALRFRVWPGFEPGSKETEDEFSPRRSAGVALALITPFSLWDLWYCFDLPRHRAHVFRQSSAGTSKHLHDEQARYLRFCPVVSSTFPISVSLTLEVASMRVIIRGTRSGQSRGLSHAITNTYNNTHMTLLERSSLFVTLYMHHPHYEHFHSALSHITLETLSYADTNPQRGVAA